MMSGLKEFLKNFLKSDSNVLRYIAYGVILVTVVFVFKCETRKRIEAEAKYESAERKIEKQEEYIERQDYLYDSVIRITEHLKIERDGVKVENNALRDSILKIDTIFANINKHGLKSAFSEYKRYRMSNGR